jgi:hypothetical protein
VNSTRSVVAMAWRRRHSHALKYGGSSLTDELLVAVVQICHEEEEPRWGDPCLGDRLFDKTDSTDIIGCTSTILLMILSLGMICFIEYCFVILPLYVR